jgi:hypothetical protein
MYRLANVCLIALCAVLSRGQAQETLLVDMRDFHPEELDVAGFALREDQKIQIEAIGVGRRDYELMATAWILNAQTRDVVWDMSKTRGSWKRHELHEVNDSVNLPKGDYEVYYAFYPYHYFSGRGHGINSVGDFANYIWNELFDRDYSYDKSQFKDLRIIIRGKGEKVSREEVDQAQKRFAEDAIVSLTGLWDDRYEQRGFRLEQPLDVQIYAVGEARDEEAYDYGWIVNATTREKLWTFNYRDSKPGGGAPKNRMVNKMISLPAGSYAAFFVTDDSHSHRRWNALPPYDPPFWGLTVRAADPAKKQFAKAYDYQNLIEEKVIAQLVRLRDGEQRSQGFTLKKPAKVRVYAVGEGRDGEMFDYGWIVNAKTRKRIWEMDYHKTEHAGGASKNRLVDEALALEAGSYIVYFITDDSHSFLDWNSSQPFDGEHWGITISGDADFDANAVAAYEENSDKSIIARLTNISDDDRRRQNFKLAKNAEVRIYAIGEGRDGDMFDYGWIEDARTGKLVWEMTYRMTEHAGGAQKNRIFDRTISLPAGEYTLCYESDGSHSCDDWNDDPPYDPMSWGITVYAADNE